MPTYAEVDAEVTRALRTIPLPSFSTGTAGSYGTFWTGAYPGSAGRACSDATAGALLPVPSHDRGRLAYGVAPLTGSMTDLIVVDRVLDVSGLAANSTALQAITHPALTRETTGELVVPWIEIAVGATGSPATTLTLAYLNQANAPKTTTIALPVNWGNTARRAFPVPLAPGDRGVRTLQSFQLANAASTAGDIALVLGKFIAFIPQTTTSIGTAYQRSGHVNLMRGALPRVRAGACVHAFGIGNSINLGNVLLTYAISEL